MFTGISLVRASALVAFVVLIAQAVFFVAPQLAAAATVTTIASEDARVLEEFPGTNYGPSSTLKTEGGADPDAESYLEYAVSGLSGTVQSATLRVYAYNSTVDGPGVYRTSTSWSESSLTWSNRPAVTSGVLGDKGSISTNTWVEYDVSSAVTGNGTYAFALRATSADSVNFYSSEGAQPPQLVVTTTTTSSPTPTTSSSPASPSPTATSTQVASTATEDARVVESSPTRNYGSSSSLKVEGGSDPDAHSYVKFSLTGVSGVVQSATLRVYAYNDTGDGPGVYRTSSAWSEGSLTWNTRPAPSGAVLTDKGAIAANTWVDYDVTPAVTGNGTHAFVFQTDSRDSVNFYSSEGANRPHLIVRTGSSSPSPSPSSTAIRIAAAGDIACDPDDVGFDGSSSTRCHMEATSDVLLANNYTAVLTLGDHQYNSGTTSEFMASYDPTWGRVKSKTYPSVGNHEYGTSNASGYFNYFGARAGDPTKGYYSFDLGGWHFLAINSNCTRISGGCAVGSPQYQWVAADLAANPARCTIAFWHHPRYSSGHDGDATFMADIWNKLYDAGAEMVLAGHSHNYERFAPQGKTANLDEARGIREFVVGTGGAFFTGISTVKPNSVARQNTTFGVLELTLRTNDYSWRFVPEAGKTFSDSGSGTCH